jgi:hypothetical protein
LQLRGLVRVLLDRQGAEIDSFIVGILERVEDGATSKTGQASALSWNSAAPSITRAVGLLLIRKRLTVALTNPSRDVHAVSRHPDHMQLDCI